ncbi:ATP-binding protein [Virgibacillus pantothenticus]|uniref:ATP/GTP-binding protein n=1 Tax=Virgibacillus pantothenticus TaxID=1473 RepID=A0A0L0QL45_VIRPA|nr:ATP-binding protein [Virgibacillus pantothenticus]KNE19286.1 ATP/GTP-binding protein [Virgibacillus pantothenticus]MED3735690.1 ATP-binding protein [Virgibacillus pantothenticus]QTY15764.1 ATP-binding protein [Virgibacillus pantothenticus]SIS96586.1 AAA-like domain-containing protein [Virgibacillus pantothenticus]
MRYPIKYLENNLVFNHDGECFAYYELLPYNYSFLSPDEKIQVHDHFRQLIAQNQDGKIHALQISTASSIRSVQDRSKELVSGRLQDVAFERIDDQTEALVSMIGEHQVDYRFFIGFKLLLNEEEVSMKSVGKSIKNSLSSFVRDVNHHLMGDFVSMPHEEVRRFSKMESLLQNKIARRFKIRPLNKNDFGYLIEHLHGQSDIAYEEYDYPLSLKKLKKETLVKRYDLIKPTRCLMEENQRYLKIEQEEQTTYVTYFTINSIVGDLEFPSDEIFYYQQQQFDFPIDTSMNVEIVTNKKALSTVRNKKKELKDLDNHAWESDNETGNNVIDALEQVNELEDVLDQTKESMYKLSYVIRVSAPNLDELKQRCNEVKDFYDDLNVKLVRPFGDMIGLHSEFIPSSKRYMNDYIQYVTSDFLAGLGFGATQMLGETEGIYFGYNLDTGRNVYLNPSLASQGIKGSVTNALASAFLGSLGGGKSFSNNLLVYYAVLFGGQALIVDPKAERGNWKETLPEIAHEINIVNLTSDDANKGLLDPFVIMKKKKDSESLAIDILTFLTGISSRDGDKFPVLRRAIRAVGQQEERGLLLVIHELRSDPNPLAGPIADHIESFTDYDFAHLLFSDGTVKNSISLEKQLNIIQVADLVLPDAETTFEEYTTMELLSVAMLIVISTFALDFIHSDRSIFKIVDLDEAWSFLQVAQGKTLSNKLVRAGRAMNAGVYFVTQNAADLTDEKLKNNIGVKFAFRSRDINEIKKTLEFFGVDKEDEANQMRLRELENGQCLMQDLYGRVGIIQVHPVFEDLFHAFDTRPPIREKEAR